jgi:phosphoenolpyruvate synthase/pyruvate phosphate dikinase
MSRFVHRLHAGAATVAQLGELGAGLVGLQRLELPVPRGFVITTEAHREAIRARGQMPAEVWEEIAMALLDLREGDPGATRRDGEGALPAVVVRPSPPARLRHVLPSVTEPKLEEAGEVDRIRQAITAIWQAWESPRAVARRELLDLPADACTGVVVQVLLGEASDCDRGTVFTRDPETGSPEPVGSLLARRRERRTRERRTRLSALRQQLSRELYRQLVGAIPLLEASRREVCEIDFVVHDDALWFVGIRQAERSSAAAVRVAVDMAHEGLITREEALARVPLSALLELQAPIAPREHARQAQPGEVRLVPAQPDINTARLLDWCEERRWLQVAQASPPGWASVDSAQQIAGAHAERLLLDLGPLLAEATPLRESLASATRAEAHELGVQLADIPPGGDLTLPPGPWTLVVGDANRSWAARLLGARPTRPASLGETPLSVLEQGR